MNIFKLILSVFITILMLLLMDPRSFYGLGFHEWAGLITGLLFILHKILNWTWIKRVTAGIKRIAAYTVMKVYSDKMIRVATTRPLRE